LGIGDWGLGIGDWAQSPIPNPQSPIPNPQSPEILISKTIIDLILNFKIKLNIKINFQYFHGFSKMPKMLDSKSYI
jgi:hypothetical protein